MNALVSFIQVKIRHSLPPRILRTAVSIFICAGLFLSLPAQLHAETSAPAADTAAAKQTSASGISADAAGSADLSAGSSSGTDVQGSSTNSSADAAAEESASPRAWPEPQEVSAEGAILIDADTGAILYQKNMNEHLYPASITKMMTVLLAAEKLDPTDTVTMSEEAVHSVPADGSNIGLDVGETITVEQALYGIMVGSANEAAAAIAEKTAGSVAAFADLMNEKAKELGCTGTHFVNANGLHDKDHYTTPHDMALIARAFFDNPLCLRIGNTPSYHFSATATQPDDFTIRNKHALITGETPCEGVIGGKTGYHQYAGETLVTGCERGGIRLICVVMKEESPNQFTDSAALLNWGYANFTEWNIAENETRFSVSRASFFDGGRCLLGDSGPAFALSPDARITLPVGTSFSDLTGRLVYSTDAETDDTCVSPDDLGASEDTATASATTASTGTASESASGAEKTAADSSVSTPDASEAASGAEQSTADSTGSIASGASEGTTDAEQSDAIKQTTPAIASLVYSWQGRTVGSANLYLLTSAAEQSDTASEKADTAGESGSATPKSDTSGDKAGTKQAAGAWTGQETDAPVSRVKVYFASMVKINDAGTIYINIRRILLFTAAVSAAVIMLLLLFSYLASFNRPERVHQERRQRQRRHKSRDYLPHNDYLKYDTLEGEDNLYYENDRWSESGPGSYADTGSGTGSYRSGSYSSGSARSGSGERLDMGPLDSGGYTGVDNTGDHDS